MTDVIAHRGASRLERENTLGAFRRAVALGADGIELDVRMAGDGALVVHHDAVVADGRPIARLARADLPEHIPTLAEALDACAGAVVNIELKNGPGEPAAVPPDVLTDRVVELLAGRPEPTDCWLLSSFRMASIDRVLQIAPDLHTAFLTPRATVEVIDETAERGHVVIHPWVETLRQPIVAHCRARGLRVNTWTCNDADQARMYAGWGVDGIITDDPVLILQALGRPTRA